MIYPNRYQKNYVEHPLSQSLDKESYYRPLTETISNFSHLENLRQLKKNVELKDPLLKSFEILKRKSIAKFSLPENEISAMLARLDRISKNTVYGQKKVELVECEKISIELLPGESQFALVFTKGKICPLNVTIQRKYGMVETYMSKKIKEPTRLINDGVFNKDFMQISDRTFFFITEFVALNFTASKNANFTVFINFGNKIVPFKKKSKNFAPSLANVGKKLVSLDVKPKPEKNFIRLNQSLQNLARAVPDLIKIEKKRNLVKERSRYLMLQKQEKRKIFIKKYELRVDAELKGMEMLDVNRRKQNFEKIWLTLLYFSSSLATVRKKINDMRIVKIKKFIRTCAARKIQYKFKEYLIKIPLKLKLEKHYLFSLSIFNHCTNFTKKFSKVNLAHCIKQNYINKRVLSTFENYFKKIVLIQNHFRDYQIINQIRLQDLDDLWSSTINAKLAKITAAKKKTKKWKKQMIDKYSSITQKSDKKL